MTDSHMSYHNGFTTVPTLNFLSKRSSGVTLIELIVVISIAAILLSVAIPSFHQLYRDSHTKAAISSINQAFSFARIAALESGKAITLCASADQHTCSSQWDKPIIIFNDANNNQVMDNQERLLKTVNTPSQFTLDWRAFGNKSYITYSPLGTINHTNGSLTLCPTDNNNRYARILIINKGGRARLATDTDNNGIVNTASGGDVNCG